MTPAALIQKLTDALEYSTTHKSDCICVNCEDKKLLIAEARTWLETQQKTEIVFSFIKHGDNISDEELAALIVQYLCNTPTTTQPEEE